MPLERRLLFRLALKMAEPNPDRLLARMPYRIWVEWVRYAALEPWGEERADYRAAQIAMLMANAWFRPEKTSPVFSIEDFMPKYERETSPKDPILTEAENAERLLNWAKDVTILMGGSIEDGHRNQTSATDN